MDKQLFAEFDAVLKRMVGQPCWSVQDSGIGSLFSMQIGEKQQRDQVMGHHEFKISVEERIFQGTFILYIEDCPWRVESSEKVLSTWLDESAPNPLRQKFIGQKVLAVDISSPGLDLAVQFEGDLTLRLFPDQVNADQGDNYSLALADKTYVVAAHSTLYVESNNQA